MKMGWGHLQALGAGCAQRASESHRFCRAVCDNGPEYGKGAVYCLDNCSDGVAEFFRGHSGAFAHAAANHHPGHARLLQIARFGGKAREIDLNIVAEWCEHRRNDSAQILQCFRKSPPGQIGCMSKLTLRKTLVNEN